MNRGKDISLAATLLFLPAVSLLLGGCAQERKMEPVPVGEMQEYHDPGIGFSIQYPVGWIINAQVGRARMYNAKDVDMKFLDPTGTGPMGVEIGITAQKMDDPKGAVETIRQELIAANFEVQQNSDVMVGDAAGTRFAFTANYGGNNIVYGHRVFFPTDSVLYDLSFSGFRDQYNAYAAVFDACLNSFRLPRPKVPGRDETLPSETMAKHTTEYFSFDYPDNFNFTNPSKGKYDLVVELRGVRQDCSIRFDVFGAEGLDVDKVFDQNKGKYRVKSTGKVTVGGEPAWMLSASPTSAVERRVYFIVKNDKVIRTTLDWYKPQRDEYLKAYDQVITSLRLK